MIARPATTSLPASLILNPRELKQYRRFQSQTTTLPPKLQGRLPTATEYADFQAWLAKRDSGYLSDTPLADIARYIHSSAEKKIEEKGKATVCGHALHPSHEDKTDRCPVCTVEMYITFMKLLTSALEDAGGLVKQRWEAKDQDCPALQAWYTGKLPFVREIGRLESLAEAEKKYEQEHQSSQVKPEAKTATQALKMYWATMESDPAMMTTPRKKMSTRNRNHNPNCKRTVVFGPETSFERGRDQHYFWRKSPRYEAGGRYASSNDSDDNQSDGSENEEDVSTSEEKPSAAKPAPGLKRTIDDGEEEASEDELSDEEDDDDDDDFEGDSEEDFENEEGDEDMDGGYVVFEYEEVVVQGAEFVVFES